MHSHFLYVFELNFSSHRWEQVSKRWCKTNCSFENKAISLFQIIDACKVPTSTLFDTQQWNLLAGWAETYASFPLRNTMGVPIKGMDKYPWMEQSYWEFVSVSIASSWQRYCITNCWLTHLKIGYLPWCRARHHSTDIFEHKDTKLFRKGWRNLESPYKLFWVKTTNHPCWDFAQHALNCRLYTSFCFVVQCSCCHHTCAFDCMLHPIKAWLSIRAFWRLRWSVWAKLMATEEMQTTKTRRKDDCWCWEGFQRK